MGRSLNAKDHAEYIGRSTHFPRAVNNHAFRCDSRTCFHRHRRRHLKCEPLHFLRQSRHTLRPLPEAAAVRIVTGRSARYHFKSCHSLHLVQPRTTRPPRSYSFMFRAMICGVMTCGVMTCRVMTLGAFNGHIGRHFMSRLHMPSVHGKHRGQRHFGPSRNGNQKHRRNHPLRHTVASLAQPKLHSCDLDHMKPCPRRQD